MCVDGGVVCVDGVVCVGDVGVGVSSICNCDGMSLLLLLLLLS